MAYEIRDRHGASRSVAYLLFAAAPFVLLTGFVLQPGQALPILIAIGTTALALALGAWVCWSRPHRLPDLFYWSAPLSATLVISGLNLMTKDASTGSQLFYLWPVLYAANFLSRRVIYLNLVAVSTGQAGVVIVALRAENAFADWIAMTIALIMTAVVVYSLRDRADQLRRKLEDQAFADPLTGLANRRAFDDALAAAGRSAPLAVITIDLDHFKGINDTYGHAAGDAALQLVAGAMREVASPDDVVARFGGDEFVMLLRGDQPAALRAVTRLQEIVAQDTTLRSGPPGLSIGVAALPEHALDVEDLVRASDTALYSAKSGGRGRVAVATMPGFTPPAPAPDPAPAAPGR
ncbi:GGDEF domain-containing protein [Actinoplanes sp. NPDC051470]|uniref:GGDEF domain-containing protein n=1 Tax=unclassified Actinoplanes TaxID=2626549 RepID=UPI00341F2985